MQYADGTSVKLGDVVSVPVPSGSAKARVVMLGDTREHLEMESTFFTWVQREPNVLGSGSVVVEWIGENPFAHNDPAFAPVGNYMFTQIDKFVKKDV